MRASNWPTAAASWGGAAELMAPKWFDKNLALSNDDNFEQLRDVLRLARDGLPRRCGADTAFGHFARHHDAHQAACAARGLQPAAGQLRPGADRPRIARRDVPHARRLVLRGGARQPAWGSARAIAQFAGFDWDAFVGTLSPAAALDARHTVGLVDAIAAADLHDPVADGLPETLEQVVARYGHRYFKLKVGGRIDADIARLTRHRRGARPQRCGLLRLARRQRAVRRRCRRRRTAGAHASKRPRWRACCARRCSSSSRSRASARSTSTCGRSPPSSR